MKSAIARCSAVMVVLVALLGTPSLCYAETTADKTSAAEVKQEARELLQALKSYTVEQREEALRNTSAALANLDRQIEALERRIDKDWDNLDQVAREKARASLKELHRQRTQVAERYGSLKSSSDEAWGHVKKGFSEAFSVLQEAWQKSEEEFGPNK